MKVSQKIWQSKTGWQEESGTSAGANRYFVLVLGPVKHLTNPNIINDINTFHPDAEKVYCSALAWFNQDQIEHDGVMVLAISFEKNNFQIVTVDVKDVKDSFDAGAHISANLDKDSLKGVILLSGALPDLNPSHLMKGMFFNLAEHVPIIGGTASDNHTQSIVGLDGEYSTTKVIAIGISGDKVKFGHGIDDAWSAFGTERFVTHAKENVVYKLDSSTPYELYKNYLEGLVEDVVAESPHFPLGMKIEGSDRRIVRGVMSIDKESGAVTFAGDVPVGSRVRMMKSNVTRLIDSSGYAAKRSKNPFEIDEPELSLVFNCKSRQTVLNEWAPEEIESMSNRLSNPGFFAGFYSAGEFAPMKPGSRSELQNQTTTIATLKEH